MCLFFGECHVFDRHHYNIRVPDLIIDARGAAFFLAISRGLFCSLLPSLRKVFKNDLSPPPSLRCGLAALNQQPLGDAQHNIIMDLLALLWNETLSCVEHEITV